MLSTNQKRVRWVLAAVALGLAAGSAAVADVKPLAKPATIHVEVAPQPVEPGDETRVTVRLEPISGVKINRYPQVKLAVAAGNLVGAAEVAVGSSEPPPPEKLYDNYFDVVEPLELTLQIDKAAKKGRHEVEGKLTYFYCVPPDFCAPKRTSISIPLDVR